MLALWSLKGELEDWYDVLAVWQHWAGDVCGHSIDCGHYMAEEAPDDIDRELFQFFTQNR